MKINHLPTLILFITVSLLLTACSKDDSAPQVPSGNIVGKVTLLDYYEKEITNKGGVDVEAISGDIKFATRTNSLGEFTLKNVPIGKVVINFTKHNFRGFDSLNFTHKQLSDSLNFIKLVEAPPAVSQLHGVYFEKGHVYITNSTDYHSNTWYLASLWFFFDNSPQVSSSKYKRRINAGSFGGSTQNPTNAFSIGFPLQEFYDRGFLKGDKVYVTLYPGNSARITYDNPEESYNWHIFPTFGNNKSNVISFTLP